MIEFISIVVFTFALALIVLGGVIGLIVSSVILPMFKLSQAMM